MARQPVQQFRMGGFFAHRAEIVRSPHQRPSKMVPPHPVDHDPGGQGIFRIDDGFGEFESSAAAGEERRRGSGHNAQETARGVFTRFQQIAPQRDLHVSMPGIRHRMHDRIRRCRLHPQGGEFFFLGRDRLFFRASRFRLGLLGGFLERVELLFAFVDGRLAPLVTINYRLGRPRRAPVVVPRVLENPGDRIIILRRDRIEFVVMTAGAGHGQSQQTAGHGVHPVVQRLRLSHCLALVGVAIRNITWPEGQKPRRRHVALRHQIARELALHKLIEGQVAIQRLHHPIAVTPRFGALALTIQKTTQPIAVAGHVQPMPAPAFPRVGRRQQAVHHPRKSVRLEVVHKSLRLLSGRGEAGQIIAGAADQGQTVCFRGGRKSRRFQTREDERIDRTAGPAGIPDRWWCRPLHRLEGPVFLAQLVPVPRHLLHGHGRRLRGPGRSHFHPLFKVGDNPLIQLRPGRHRGVRIVVFHGLIQQAPGGIAHHHGGPAPAPF